MPRLFAAFQWILETALIVVAYWALAWLGQLTAIEPANVTPVWPPSGFALAVVLWRGYRVWPALWLGNFLANAPAFLDTSTLDRTLITLATGLAIGPGDVFQAVLGAYLLRHWRGEARPFTRVGSVFSFVGKQAVACLSSASFGVLALCAGGVLEWSRYGATWTTWYLGDFLGVILVAPFLLTLGELPVLLRAPAKLLETGAILVAAAITSQLAFSGMLPREFIYLTLPCILWAGARGGRFVVSGTVVAISVVAVTYTAVGGAPDRGVATSVSLISWQIYTGLTAVTGLAIAAALDERREAEANLRDAADELRRSEQRYRAIVDSAPEAIVVLDADTQRFTDANENAAQLFGLRKDELLRKSLSDLTPPIQIDGTPSSGQAARQIQVALNGAQAIFDWTYWNAHSEPIACEVRLVRLPAQHRRLIRASITDISRRLESARQLRIARDVAAAANRRLQHALGAGNVGLWDWDMTTNQVFYSDQFKRQLGYDPSTHLDSYEDWESRLHPADREAALAAIEDYVEGRTDDYRPVFRMRRKDGSYCWILSQGKITRDEQGIPVRMIGVHIDITLRKKQQEELERYSRELERRNSELDDFTYVASHDLKSPLRGIQQLTEWLEDDVGELLPEESRKHLRQLRQRVGRMQKLIDDLLAYSRAGRMHGDESEVDVAALLEEVLDSLVFPPQLTIHRDLPRVVLRTFRIPLFQVLLNLVGNAVKHHDKPRGNVWITLVEHDQFVEFRVRDDGPGIPPESHDRVFRIFETLRSNADEESTGIGLAIVHKTVEYYGGTVQLASAEGQGTTLSFTWPKQIRVVDEIDSTQPTRKVQELPPFAAEPEHQQTRDTLDLGLGEDLGG